MVTLNVSTQPYYDDWGPDWVEQFINNADPYRPSDYSGMYFSGMGVSLPTIRDVMSTVLDEWGKELLLIGRAPAIDQILNELAVFPAPDIQWCPGRRLEQIAWWRGTLIVRMLHWRHELGHVMFPANELWLLPLERARTHTIGFDAPFIRYVDTALAP